MHSKDDTTDVHIGYTMDKDFNSFVPKPCILYMNGVITQDVKLNGTTYGSYTIFGSLTDLGLF